MIGGFLGAGKTTAVIKFAQWLRDIKGLRVGIITNDQAEGLVDTALAKRDSFITSEIAGGCFCCRSDELLKATDSLRDQIKPHVFIAEPVGSCTDLVATVSLPLMKIYKKDYDIAPMAVLIDPFRALGIVERFSDAPKCAARSGSFSEEIDYIYVKQLEEAEIIVINKLDVVPRHRLERLKELLEGVYPDARLLAVSARTGQGLEDWFEMLLAGSLNVSRVMDVDYERYGRGEAKLGWFNGKYLVQAQGASDFDGNTLLMQFAHAVRTRFLSHGTEVAHLKVSLASGASEAADSDIGAVQWVASERDPEMTIGLAAPIHEGVFTINIRAEDDPDRISQTVDEVLSYFKTVRFLTVHAKHFRPGQPKPIFRVADPRDSGRMPISMPLS